MENTYQFENINMLDHGNMVHEEYKKIKGDLKSYNIILELTSEQMEWLINHQYDIDIMENYHIYHDCGKPYCRVINEEGKQQFPNHARVSYEIYKKYFNNHMVAELILLDMNFHVLKSEDLQKWLEQNKLNPSLLASLYLTAWAELFANSTMFGGYETTSFKIKKKALLRAGNKLFKLFSI